MKSQEILIQLRAKAATIVAAHSARDEAERQARKTNEDYLLAKLAYEDLVNDLRNAVFHEAQEAIEILNEAPATP